MLQNPPIIPVLLGLLLGFLGAFLTSGALITDDFNVNIRADEADLAGLAFQWYSRGEERGVWKIESQNLVAEGPNLPDAEHKFSRLLVGSSGPHWVDYCIQAVVKPSADGAAGLLVRYLDDKNFYSILLKGQNVDIRKFSSGQSADGVSMGQLTATSTATSRYMIKVCTVARHIIVELPDQSGGKIQVHDGSNAHESGGVGVACSQKRCEFDDFSVSEAPEPLTMTTAEGSEAVMIAGETGIGNVQVALTSDFHDAPGEKITAYISTSAYAKIPRGGN